MQAEQGLTLVEMLVAMAIMGIVFVLVTNWQVSTLSISTRTNAMSQRLTDLTDATGYVGDRVRAAIAVRDSGFTVNASGATAATNSGKCDAVTPCLALLIPESDEQLKGAVTLSDSSATPKIGPLSTTGVRYRVYVYRMEPRSILNADDRMDDAWADDSTNKVMVLREYRGVVASGSVTATVCPEAVTTAAGSTTSCNALATHFRTASAFSGLQPYLVTDHLSLTNASGGALTPFAWDAGTRTITLRFQTKQSVRGNVTFLPATPYTLKVQARNVAP
ncbi:type II secretion system protein J [Deinococcus sp. NW-56]|uniref:PulJ/GspJ family protein n=1 Tax=Deinococcus sp. NW-56 TaxID=2080419 RepID=UPI000CF3F179|nr:prepilin-type N-terminal cleavage/methylation domain-containing protein [Deinococcus sp. NW-56]